jgi:hypothetical protein
MKAVGAQLPAVARTCRRFVLSSDLFGIVVDFERDQRRLLALLAETNSPGRWALAEVQSAVLCQNITLPSRAGL